MSPDAFKNPYAFKDHDFAPRGEIKLAPGALQEARQFLSELGANEDGSKWVVAFTWCYKRAFRKSPDAPSIDEGPGLDIAGYRSTEIPANAIDVREGVSLTFIIPPDQLEKAKDKMIVERRLQSGRMSYELI
jgi:hypothetical protein